MNGTTLTDTQARRLAVILANLRQSEAPVGAATEAPMSAASGANQKALSRA